MSDKAAELADLKTILNSLIVPNPSGLSLRHLCNDYQELEGKMIPFREFGFTSVTALLKSMPDKVRMIGHLADINSVTLFPVRNEQNAHVVDLVRGQNKSKKGKRGKARTPFYPTRFVGAHTFQRPRPTQPTPRPFSRSYNGLNSQITANYYPDSTALINTCQTKLYEDLWWAYYNYYDSLSRLRPSLLPNQSTTYNYRPPLLQNCVPAARPLAPNTNNGYFPRVTTNYNHLQVDPGIVEKWKNFTISKPVAGASQGPSKTVAPSRSASDLRSVVINNGPARPMATETYNGPKGQLPHNIKENIRELMHLEGMSDGLMLYNFVARYKQHFKQVFDIKTYGFDTLADCLQTIPDVIELIPAGKTFKLMPAKKMSAQHSPERPSGLPQSSVTSPKSPNTIKTVPKLVRTVRSNNSLSPNKEIASATTQTTTNSVNPMTATAQPQPTTASITTINQTVTPIVSPPLRSLISDKSQSSSPLVRTKPLMTFKVNKNTAKANSQPSEVPPIERPVQDTVKPVSTATITTSTALPNSSQRPQPISYISPKPCLQPLANTSEPKQPNVAVESGPELPFIPSSISPIAVPPDAESVRSFESAVNLNPIAKHNFRTILMLHEDGIKAVDFPDEYQRICKVVFDSRIWGFRTPLEMFHNLDQIFSIEVNDKNEHILHDARFKKFEKPKTDLQSIELNGAYKLDHLDDRTKAQILRTIKLCDSGVAIDDFERLYSFNFGSLDLNKLRVPDIRYLFGALKNELPIDIKRVEGKSSDYYIFLTSEDEVKEWVISHTRHHRFVVAHVMIDTPDGAVLPGEEFPSLKMPEKFEPGAYEYVAIYISSAVNPQEIYVQFKGDKYHSALEQVMHQLDCYDKELAAEQWAVPYEFLYIGYPVICRYPGDRNYHRARVSRIHANKKMVTVYFVDYGGTHVVDYKDLRLMKREFLQLPAQALRVGLYGIKPIGGNRVSDWTASARDKILRFSQPQYALACTLIETSNGVHWVALCDTNTDVDVFLHSVLIAENHAVLKSEEELTNGEHNQRDETQSQVYDNRTAIAANGY